MNDRCLTGATFAPPMSEQFTFDPTHGFTLTDLLDVPPPDDEPSDLDEFWSGVSVEAAAVRNDVEISDWEQLTKNPTVEVAEIQYRSLDGVWIGSWVTRPRTGATQALVIGHGYGGRDAPDLTDVPSDAVAIFPVARGLPDRSNVVGVGGPTGIDHVLWGIQSPREYSHIGSVVDTWLAARILGDLFPKLGRPIYMGGSFGGGIGALALAFGTDFAAGVLEVPSFGNHPLRASLQSTGSASRVNNYLHRHPEALATLRYADAASAARRVHVPVLAMPALADPGVPAPGQFAVTNALAGPTWVHVLPHGHCLGGDGCENAGRSEAIAKFLGGSTERSPRAN